MNNRIKALATHLEVKGSGIEPSRYGDNQFENDGQEWLVLTDREATKAARDQIRDSLWAFNYSFLRCHLRRGIDSDAMEKSVKHMQETLCESCNEAIFALIGDFSHFVNDAISADGRGHFLSPYDGEEQEVKVGKTMYFLYRLN
jgi:hypothetical protein